MKILFETSSYLKAVKENGQHEDNESIYLNAKKELKFSHAHVTRKEFEKHYSQNTLKGRKCKSIKAAFRCVIVDMVYHLACTIFVGIIKSFHDKGKYFKLHLFFAARHFQEGYGHITSLCFQKYGAFYIQKGQFERTCYTIFRTQAPLLKLSTMTPQELNDAFPLPIEIFPLQKTRDDAILRMAEFSSKDVNAAIKAGILFERWHLEFLSPEHFTDIELSTLLESKDCKLNVESIRHYLLKATCHSYHFRSDTRLAHVKPEEVEKAIHKGLLSHSGGTPLGNMSKEQWEYLTLSNMPKKVIDEIFMFSRIGGAVRYTVEFYDMAFPLFKVADVKKALQTKLLTTQFQLALISEKQIREMGGKQTQPPFTVEPNVFIVHTDDKIYFQQDFYGTGLSRQRQRSEWYEIPI